MASINIKKISVDQSTFCFKCNAFSAKGALLDIQDLNDTEYLQLQECGWRRSGEQFYHTNQKSCCQQTVCKLAVRDYMQPQSLKKALRKLTSEYFDIDQIKQSVYSNLLQYIDQSRPSPLTLQTNHAFYDYLASLSLRLTCTSISSSGFKFHPADTLRSHVAALNEKMHVNVRVDGQNRLHFRWLNDFKLLLEKQKRTTLSITVNQAYYDEETHNFYNNNYFEIPQSTYVRTFCGDQYKMVKYYIQQNLVAVGFLEVRQNSLHRLAFHFNKNASQINRIAIDAEINLAKKLTLSHYYFIQITKEQKQIKTSQPIKDDFIILCGSKSIQIKYLKQSYKKYLTELLYQLNSLMSAELIQHFIFKYS